MVFDAAGMCGTGGGNTAFETGGTDDMLEMTLEGEAMLDGD